MKKTETRKELSPDYVCVRNNLYINKEKEVYQYDEKTKQYIRRNIRSNNTFFARAVTDDGKEHITSLSLGQIYAEAFIPSGGKRAICYRDKNKLNVSEENIQWIGPVYLKKLPENAKETGLDGVYVTKTGEVYKKQGTGFYQVTENLVGGYRSVQVNGTSYNVHRLVALAYVPNPNKYTDVRFKDGNKENIDPSNLVWVNRNPHDQDFHWREICPVCGRGTRKKYLEKHKVCSVCFNRALVKQKRQEQTQNHTEQKKENASDLLGNPALTQRQKIVVAFRAQGMTFHEIGNRMGTSSQNAQALYKQAEKNAAKKKTRLS